MIYTALYELENTPVLSPDQAIKIKSYIKSKYHYFTNEEAASVFADAVHKILDNELKIFSKTERQTIKKDILTSAVYREQFFLTGYDVFKGIIHVEKSAGDFIILVKEWLRTHFDYSKSSMFVQDIEDYINDLDILKTPQVSVKANVVEQDSTILLDQNNIKPEVEFVVETSSYDVAINADIPYEENQFVKDSFMHSYNYALEKVCDGYNSLISSGHTALMQGEKLINHTKSLVLEKEWKDAIWDRIANPVKASIVAVGIVAAIQTNAFVESNINNNTSSVLVENSAMTYEVEYLMDSNDVMVPHILGKSSDNSEKYNEAEFVKNIVNSKIDNSKVASNLSDSTTKDIVTSIPSTVVLNTVTPQSDGFVEFTYRSIDEVSMRNYLKKRNSILAEEPYFSTIIESAKEHNINPIILFAITGQEQGFVSKKSSSASIIANNPFNVYGSWKKYNTDIEDSSKIASITLIRLYEGCPDGTDPIKWINRKYAEDKDWHRGVNSIIEEIESRVNYNNI